MKGKIALLISLLIIISFVSGCTTSEVFVNNNEFYGCIQEPVFMDTEAQGQIDQQYAQYLSDCINECTTCNCEADAKLAVAYDLEDEWAPGTLGKEVTLPFTYAVSRCVPTQKTRLNNADLGLDMKDCPDLEVDGFNAFESPFYSLILYYLESLKLKNQQGPIGCNPTSFKSQYLPPNSQCQLKETYLTVVVSDNKIPLIINGRQIIPVLQEGHFFYLVLFISGWDIDLLEEEIGLPFFSEIPSTINITYDEQYDGEKSADVFIYRECCWDCNPKPSLPATILYPKVDIESFTLDNGDAIIKDGKIISSFTIVPGVQNTTIGVENRGFFTQNNVYIKLVGLPEGVEANTIPELQKIKAHNIGTYETTFTVGPNVPSGTYKISMIAYSPNGILDTILMGLVIP